MYRIFQFGEINLPPVMPEDDLSTGEVESTLLDSVGGVYDAWGTKRRLPRRQIIPYRGMYDLLDNGRFADGLSLYLVASAGNNLVTEAGDRLIVDNGQISMRRNADLLKAQEGTAQRLYRRREDDNELSWKLSRLQKVNYVRTLADANAVAHIEAIFETRMATWRSNNLSSFTLPLPAALSLANLGDVTIYDAILTIFATVTMTTITITGPLINLTWTGTLSAGERLVIDNGLQTVRREGLDAYSGLVRNVGHTAVGWIPVITGSSILSVTANAAGTAGITYYEQRF